LGGLLDICLFSDFDGPLVDVSERYYQVYRFILPKAGSSSPVTYLTKDEFWQCKRAQISEREIGRRSGLTEPQAEAFTALRRQYVHAVEFFEYDQVQPGVHGQLTRLQQRGVELAVVTMRRTRELEPALARFDLAQFFPVTRRYCLPNDYAKSNDVFDKRLLLAEAYGSAHQHQRCYMVGDTEADILAAQRLHIPALGVLCGIRDEERIAALSPWRIVMDLGEAVTSILADLS
jgi:phosphoglycolate phosphatase-like HAD superfamily hydrolase